MFKLSSFEFCETCFIFLFYEPFQLEYLYQSHLGTIPSEPLHYLFPGAVLGMIFLVVCLDREGPPSPPIWSLSKYWGASGGGGGGHDSFL